MKVLAFNIMSFKSVLYQFRGSNKVTVHLFLMFPYHDLKIIDSRIFDNEKSTFTRLITKLGVMKQVQQRCPWKDFSLLSLLNFLAISIQYFSVRPSVDNYLFCRQSDTSLANSDFLWPDMLLWWCHFQNYVNVELEKMLIVSFFSLQPHFHSLFNKSTTTFTFSLLLLLI